LWEAGLPLVLAGWPQLLHFVGKVLHQLGFAPDQNYVTLEARMHCGIGKCGRCNLGDKLVCVNGPVFSMAEVAGLLESFL
jgi:NAD(P)H-flavin reductase